MIQVKIEIMSILSEHKRSVNCVKFSPVLSQGLPVLASSDDDGVVCLWTKCDEKERYAASFMDDHSDLNKEYWKVSRTLRGHIEEIQDLCWNTDGSLLLSGSIDTSARLWNTATGQCLHAFRESKGLIQGVSIDPLGKYIATFADDKSVRIYHATNKRCAFKNTKFSYNDKLIKLFGDTGDGFFHRVCFSPNGEFFMVPSASYQLSAESSIFCTYVYCRDSLNKPALYLPCGKRPSVAVAFCPLKFKLRNNSKRDESSSVGTIFNLQYRLIFTVITEQSLLFYDTEKLDPFAKIESIHYASLNSGSWNNDGTLFVATSSDGYATICSFEIGELGEIMANAEVIFQTVQTPQSTPITKLQEKEETVDSDSQTSVLLENQNDTNKENYVMNNEDEMTESPKKISPRKDTAGTLESEANKANVEARDTEQSGKKDKKDVVKQDLERKDAAPEVEEEDIMCIDGPSTPKSKFDITSKSASKLATSMASKPPCTSKSVERKSLGSSFFKRQAEKDKKGKNAKKAADVNMKRNQILSSFARGNRILAESLRLQKENFAKNEDPSENKENANATLKPITIDDDSNSSPINVATTPKPSKEKPAETPPRNPSAPTTPKSILKTPSPDSPLVASGKKRRVSFKNIDNANKEISKKEGKLETVKDVEMEELPPLVEKASEKNDSEGPSKKRKVPFVTLA